MDPFKPKCSRPSRWGATVVQPSHLLYLSCSCPLLHCLRGQVQGHLSFAVGFRELFRRVKTTVLNNLRTGLPHSVAVWKATKILGLSRKGVERETTLLCCSVNSVCILNAQRENRKTWILDTRSLSKKHIAELKKLWRQVLSKTVGVWTSILMRENQIAHV